VKTIAKIIEIYGGLEWLRQPGSYIRLENPPYMRLVIEYVGEGPRGMPSISVAHYYEQNGDAVRDPEIVFEVNPEEDGLRSWKKGKWGPVSYQQDNLGAYQEAVFVSDTGQVMFRPNLFLDLKAFAWEWDQNIEQQGFLSVAKAGAQKQSEHRR
jgi:Domain of unknown function (DUF6908)